MNKCRLLILLAIICAVVANAQPVLTGPANNPVTGDIFYGHGLFATNLHLGDSGINVFWDFHDVTDAEHDTNTFISCSTAPFGSLYPDATTCSVLYGVDNYYKGDNNAYTLIGNHSRPYQDRADVMRYPFTYHSSFTDTGLLTWSASDSITTVSTSYADGYGTLLLPNGIYSNVLRRKLVVHRHILMSGGTDFTNVTINYEWYKPGIHTPLLVIGADTIGGVVTAAGGTYYVDASHPTGIAQAATNGGQVTISPNPTTGNTFRVLAMDNILSAEVYDISGRRMNILKLDQITNNEAVITTDDIAPGLYLVRVATNGGRYSCKLICQ